jgi:hypothetical protein
MANNSASGLQQAAAASVCAASIVVAVSAALVARRTIALLSGVDRTRHTIDDGLAKIQPAVNQFSDLATRLGETLRTAQAAAAEMRRTVDAVKRSPVGGLLQGRERAE